MLINNQDFNNCFFPNCVFREIYGYSPVSINVCSYWFYLLHEFDVFLSHFFSQIFSRLEAYKSIELF